ADEDEDEGLPEVVEADDEAGDEDDEDEDEAVAEDKAGEEAGDDDSDDDADAASHLKLKDWYSPAARRAIRGESKGALRHWKLTDILIYDVKKPPSGIKKTKGSATMVTVKGNKVMKERWRCKHCDALRQVDPKITTSLSHHSKHQCPVTAQK
ncbi:hypothetical protein OC842_006351, partial [Tilletia horrida]